MSHACQEIATVIGLESSGRAVVKIRRAEACHSCAAKGACHTLGGKTQDISLVVENTLEAKPGDEVVLSLDESAVIKASAVLYLVPAAGLVVGAMSGWALGHQWGYGTDPSSIVGAIVGLALGLGLTRLAGARMSKETKYLPRLTAISSRVRD